MGTVAGHAGDREVPRRQDRRAHGARKVDPVKNKGAQGAQGAQGARETVDHVELARRLIDIESTTGNEGDVALFLASYLRDRGYSVLEQPLDAISGKPRSIVIAAVGEP